MKKPDIKIVLFTLLSLMFFGACNNDDDGYSLAKQWEALATVHPTGEASYYLVLDDGTKLGVLASGVNYEPKENQRVYVNFTLLDKEETEFDYCAKVNRISDILTKGVIDLTVENQDSIGNDPVKIHSLWIGDDYLNIYFGFDAGGEKTHFINLVYNTMAGHYADAGRIDLEFRHNANDDPEWYPSDGFVAFDLRPYKELLQDRDSVELVIGVQDFDNEYKTYRRTYKFDANATEAQPLKYGLNNDATLFR